MAEFVGTAAWEVSIGLRWRIGIMRGVFMGYGGLGLGAYKEGLSCLSSPNTPYPRVPLSPSFPSGELCYEPGNGEGEFDSERQTREVP